MFIITPKPQTNNTITVQPINRTGHLPPLARRNRTFKNRKHYNRKSKHETPYLP